MKRHESPTIRFDYPDHWQVSEDGAFQIVNTRAPHGAITVTLFRLKQVGEAGEARLRFADRRPTGQLDTWTVASGALAGLVTWVHGGEPEPETADVQAIIDSLVLTTPPRRSFWQRLFSR
jgi:hypothetical protein